MKLPSAVMFKGSKGFIAYLGTSLSGCSLSRYQPLSTPRYLIFAISQSSTQISNASNIKLSKLPLPISSLARTASKETADPRNTRNLEFGRWRIRLAIDSGPRLAATPFSLWHASKSLGDMLPAATPGRLC